jgi:hypothetical protein
MYSFGGKISTWTLNGWALMDDFVGKCFSTSTLNPYADFGFGLKLETNVWMPRGNLAVQSRL